MRERKSTDLSGWGSREDVGEVGRRETVTRK